MWPDDNTDSNADNNKSTTPRLSMPANVPGVSLTDNAMSLRKVLLADSTENNSTENNSAGNNADIHIDMDEKTGEGFIEFVEINDQFSMIISKCQWLEKQFVKYSGEGWIRFNFCLDTTASFLFDNIAQYDLRGAECRVFHQPVGVDCGHFINAKTPSICVTLSAQRDYLTTRLMPEIEQLDDPLRALLKNQGDDFFFERMPLSNQMARSVTDMVHSPYRNNLRRMHLESKAHELLCQAFYSMLYPSYEHIIPIRLTEADNRRIKQARDIIESDFIDPPSVPTLARLVGLNRNKLTYGFKYLFNMPILDYTIKLRLEKAWDMLQQTDLSIAQISSSVGYQHQASFSAAFKAFFSLSPREARKNRHGAMHK